LGAKEAALHVLDGLTGFLVFSLMTVAFHERGAYKCSMRYIYT